MTRELKGALEGEGLRIVVVVARFNEFITTRLLEGAKAAMASHGVEDDNVTVAWVPGSFEIPLAAQKLAESHKYDAVVCLGAVIRGDTDHYEYVAGEAANGIAAVSQSTGTPVIFGILTTDTVEQALERAGGENGTHAQMPRAATKAHPMAEAEGDGHGNAGYNAGVAAIEMANLLRAIKAD